MPLDTSIPLQVQIPQFGDAVDPATRQYNALRMQALQQDMARNQLIMQNTMEDRRREEANRRAAAANAAAELRRKQEFMQTIRSGYDPGKTVGMGPGTIQGSTPASYDPNRVLNALYAKGDPAMIKSFSDMQEQLAKQQKAEAEVPGVRAESRKKGTEADIAEYNAAVARLVPLVRSVKSGQDAASFEDAMYDDPVLGPRLEKVVPRAQAVARAAAEYEADPLAWMRSRMLTGKELSDAFAAATEKIETPQGYVEYNVGKGTARPITMQGTQGAPGQPVMPVDRRSVTNISTVDTASEAAMKEYMKDASEQRKVLTSAPTVLDNIEKAKALIPSAKTFMGTGGEGLLGITKFFNNRLGTKINTEDVSSAEELRSRLFAGVLDNLKKLDSQPTQLQQTALQEAMGKLDTDPNALPQVLDIMGDILRTKVDLYNTDVTEAEKRGVKFPFKPQIDLPAKKSANGAGATSVTTPNGKVYSFPTPEAAAQFKKAAGIP